MSADHLFDDDEFREITQHEEFLILVADGVGYQRAGFQVGWTPRQIKANLADPDFAEMVHYAKERMVDDVQLAMVNLAKKGNLGAQQMILYNLRGEVWRDVKRIEVRSDVTVSIVEVEAAKAAALEALRSGMIGELQPGEIIDAEVIEDESDLGS